MAYPPYKLEIKVVNGSWEVGGVTVPQPVVITGTHAGLMVKNNVRFNATFVHHDDEVDTMPHILITFE